MSAIRDPELLLGLLEGDRVRLRVFGRAHPGGLAVFDDNWLLADGSVDTAHRSFRFQAFLRAEDFVAFDRSLGDMIAGDADTAELWPRDPWVSIELRARPGPGCHAAVRARDGGSERAVAFSFELDDAGLRQMSRQAAEVASRFPVVR